MNQREIKEAIDACRPDTEDVGLPEMAPLAGELERDGDARRWYERTQQCDVAIGSAFGDVPVPQGLRDRILAALGCHVEPEGDAPMRPRDVAPDVYRRGEDRKLAVKRWRNRKAAIGWIAATAAVAAAFWLALVRLHRPPDFSTESLPGEVAVWIEALHHAHWSADVTNAQIRDYRLDAAVRRPPRRWCRIQTPYDAHAIAYDLARPGQDLAVAFCIRRRTNKPALSSVPTPIPSTAGTVIAVWQRGATIYVLAVRGGRQRYRQFVESGLLIGWRRPGGPAVFLIDKV